MPTSPTHFCRQRALLCVVLLAGAASLAMGCRRSGDAQRPPPDVTIDNPRAGRLAGSWIGFNQSLNAPWEFVAATFETRGDYNAVLYSNGQQSEQSGKWRVEAGQLVLDGKQKWELEFRGENMVVLRDPEARVYHQLTRRK